MPQFKGPRKERWYTARKTADQIAIRLKHGRWANTNWNSGKACYVAFAITGEEHVKKDLRAAYDALERYCERELQAERWEDIDAYVKTR